MSDPHHKKKEHRDDRRQYAHRPRRESTLAPPFQPTTLGPLSRTSSASSASSTRSQSAILAALGTQNFRKTNDSAVSFSRRPNSRPPSSRPPSSRKVDGDAILKGDLDDALTPQYLSSSDEDDSDVSDHLEHPQRRRRSFSAQRNSRPKTPTRTTTDEWEHLSPGREGKVGAPNGAAQYGYQSPVGGEAFSDVEDEVSGDERYAGNTAARRKRNLANCWPLSRQG